MIIGCPKEIKPQEFRVGLTPNAAHEAVNNGHSVLIETLAGIGGIQQHLLVDQFSDVFVQACLELSEAFSARVISSALTV